MKLSICIPCYNEEKNIEAMYLAVKNELAKLSHYDHEIVFRDNASTDSSMVILREIAKKDHCVKVIENTKNYGINPDRDTFIGRVNGDVLIYIPCDFQEPPELIPEFVQWFERGYDVVCGEKIGSKEGKVKYGLRQLFYGIINKMSNTNQYKNLSGIVLVSREIQELQWSHNTDIAFRFFLADVGIRIKTIPYVQNKRKAGKSSYNISSYFSFAMESLISTSTMPLRIMTLLGMFMSTISFIIGMVYLIYKLIWWKDFYVGMAPILIGMFFLGAIIIFFIGVVGEYIGVIFRRVTPKNPTTVKELINFGEVNDSYYIREREIK